MKKILISGIAVLLSIFMFSCGGGGDDGGASPTNDYIRIDNNVNSISLAAADEQRKISIYSNCKIFNQILNMFNIAIFIMSAAVP